MTPRILQPKAELPTFSNHEGNMGTPEFERWFARNYSNTYHLPSVAQGLKTMAWNAWRAGREALAPELRQPQRQLAAK